MQQGSLYLNRNMLFSIAGLTAVWIILFEKFTVPLMAAGVVVSAGCVYICNRLLPLPKTANIKTFGLIIYPFYLIIQVYLSAFNAIKLILTGVDVDFIEVKTKLSNNFLRTILANSITLTPGSVSLELKDDTITLLWLKGKTESHQDAEKAGESIKSKLERILLRAES